MSEQVEDGAIYEGDVAEQLGVDRRVVSRIRLELGLEQDVDWVNGPHRRLMLLPRGVEKIERGLAAERAEDGADGAVMRDVVDVIKNLPVGRVRQPERRVARVRRVPGFRKLIECDLEDGTRIKVRVQDNKNFTERMLVPVREAVGQGPGMWYFDGPLPVRKGVMPKFNQK